MNRVTRGVVKRHRKNKYLKLAKGNFGRHNRCYVIARRILERAWAFSFKGRKERKRTFRSKFIAVINTFCRQNNSKYSIFINKFNQHALSKTIDRKSLALIIQHNQDYAMCIYNNIINNTN